MAGRRSGNQSYRKRHPWLELQSAGSAKDSRAAGADVVHDAQHEPVAAHEHLTPIERRRQLCWVGEGLLPRTKCLFDMVLVLGRALLHHLRRPGEVLAMARAFTACGTCWRSLCGRFAAAIFADAKLRPRAAVARLCEYHAVSHADIGCVHRTACPEMCLQMLWFPAEDLESFCRRCGRRHLPDLLQGQLQGHRTLFCSSMGLLKVSVMRIGQPREDDLAALHH